LDGALFSALQGSKLVLCLLWLLCVGKCDHDSRCCSAALPVSAVHRATHSGVFPHGAGRLLATELRCVGVLGSPVMIDRLAPVVVVLGVACETTKHLFVCYNMRRYERSARTLGGMR
jgi:hypothetical protein